MVYIVCALYIEAKPLIDKYKLKKNNNLTKFQVFSNENIKLILSGVGKIKSAIALTYLITNEKIDKNACVMNFGYAGTTINSVKLGDIFIPNKITAKTNEKNFYLDMIYKHNFLEGTLSTFDKILEKSEENVDYIDMEAYGFYEAASYFFKRDKIIILKIISDILFEKKEDRKMIDFNESSKLDKTYEKIFNFLDELILSLKEKNTLFSKEEIAYIQKLEIRLKFSETMLNEFKNIVRYLKLSEKNIFEFFKCYENVEIKNKIEVKKYFEDIKKRIE